MKLEQITDFKPAYDKRHKDPKKDYGIHSVHCWMIHKGKKGAVHFSFSTGMLLEKTMIEYIKDGRAKYEIMSWGHHFLNKPMGFDVGYHSLKPLEDYHKENPRKNCCWLDNKTCYGNGSALRGEKFLKILIEKGSDEVWKMLEKDYKELFTNKQLMSHPTNTLLAEDKKVYREIWLYEQGRTDGDIMIDDKGEYIIEMDEEGAKTRVYFPNHLQHE